MAHRNSDAPIASLTVTQGELRVRLSKTVCSNAVHVGDRFTGAVSRVVYVFPPNGLPEAVPDTTFPSGLIADVVVTAAGLTAAEPFELTLRSLRQRRLHVDGLSPTLDPDPEVFQRESDRKCYPKGELLITSLDRAVILRE